MTGANRGGVAAMVFRSRAPDCLAREGATRRGKAIVDGHATGHELLIGRSVTTDWEGAHVVPRDGDRAEAIIDVATTTRASRELANRCESTPPRLVTTASPRRYASSQALAPWPRRPAESG
jgi:hypothetical protein